MTANPWDKFFWADYENDPPLKLCSFAAQGLWMRMLCICAKSEPKGYLIVAGNALTLDDMASLFGKKAEEIEPLLNELRNKEVFSTDRTGKIYNRKMVRNAKKARTARQNGKNGGNPTLLKQTDIPASDNQNPTDDDTYICIDPPTDDPTNAPGNNQKPEARSQKEGLKLDFEVWYAAYPRHVARKTAEKAYEKARKSATADQLLQGVETYRRIKPEYADWKHPATWLNGECWLDEGGAQPRQTQLPQRQSPGTVDAAALADRERAGLRQSRLRVLMEAGYPKADALAIVAKDPTDAEIAAKVAERENKPGDVSREIAPRPSEPSLYERITGVRRTERPRAPAEDPEKVTDHNLLAESQGLPSTSHRIQGAAAPRESTATPANPPCASGNDAPRESTSNEGEKSYEAPDPLDLGPFGRKQAAE